MKSILFVCAGNTCRSPMAEALLDCAIEASDHLYGKYRVDSAGTFAVKGSPAAPNAIEAMREMGLNIEKHRTKQVDEELAEWADIILALDTSIYDQLEAMFPKAEEKLHTLVGFANYEDGYPGTRGYDIEDPFGEDEETYRECAEEIKAAVEKVAVRLEKEETEQES